MEWRLQDLAVSFLEAARFVSWFWLVKENKTAITVFGLMAGAAVAHNFGLASSGEGPTANGKIAVVIGFVVLIVIATVNSMRKNEA